MNPYAIAAGAAAFLMVAAWLIVRAYGRERSRAAAKDIELGHARVDRDKEARKSALDIDSLPADRDELWVQDE